MIEPDDRLAGDHVWELFPTPPDKVTSSGSLLTHAMLAVLISGGWLLLPPAAVLLACFWAARKDFSAGWQMPRLIHDRAGRRICSAFAYASGAWKLSITAFFMIMVAILIADLQQANLRDTPPAAMTAMLLWMGGLLAAAFLTASGLVLAFRSGMRVWIGEGFNQVGTLLFAMLLTGFCVFVILPFCFWVTEGLPLGWGRTAPVMGVCIALLIGGPIVLMVALDWFTRRIVADRPSKFGSKVPAVGKWES